ncbi:glycoside hydrolase family 9 protein [Cohnella ginsengisoli]|uniref:Glycoside hydrolase family 9 protein n=1 Tax=Cohnella ginsengisoli TaxID=425004 RepID=A0A9X4KHW7_9BACL|nr:glycoside hydrolase family 9 protein [Cohnella ginsengisoli]MDG0792462.1 glycoside hydrolase family 9 protein [Cohnella ginsengisoli]
MLSLCLFAGSWPAPGAKAEAAVPGATVQKYIMIDQFGYLPDGDKTAVLVDPQVGYNASDAYTPGGTLEVRRVSDDSVAFSGAPKVWNDGKTQEKSGDRGWWFDFSEVTATGDYYIYDPANNFKSYDFTISPDVYKDVLKAAIKTYYYQRIGTPHLAQHAGAAFADDAAFVGPYQDTQARSVLDRNNAATERDLSGGWMDAGDFNKYVTYTAQPINELLTAYEQKPDIFTDDYNIPESGNGIPDVIDEVKWELDWLKKMQESDGGVLMKVGVPSSGKIGEFSNPPSKITVRRYYLPKTSASTIVTALNFAHAAVTLGQFPTLRGYADDLKARAIKAWSWYQNNPKTANADHGEIEAGDADMALAQQAQVATVAAAYLFALTGDQSYHTYFKTNYTTTWPMSDAYWGLYYGEQADGVMFYTTLPNADPAVRAHILERRDLHDFTQAFVDNEDLYRSYVPDFSYHWGSLQVRARAGASSYDFVQYDINPQKRDNFNKKGAKRTSLLPRRQSASLYVPDEHGRLRRGKLDQGNLSQLVRGRFAVGQRASGIRAWRTERAIFGQPIAAAGAACAEDVQRLERHRHEMAGPHGQFLGDYRERHLLPIGIYQAARQIRKRAGRADRAAGRAGCRLRRSRGYDVHAGELEPRAGRDGLRYRGERHGAGQRTGALLHA